MQALKWPIGVALPMHVDPIQHVCGGVYFINVSHCLTVQATLQANDGSRINIVPNVRISSNTELHIFMHNTVKTFRESFQNQIDTVRQL